jgi:hypothetical protein
MKGIGIMEISISNVLYYDETSPSCLRWKTDIYTGKNYKTAIVCAGDAAGHLDNTNGYYCVRWRKKKYFAHKIIWELFHEKKEVYQNIDHINGIKTDNKIDNLRLVPQAINTRNCKMKSNNLSGVTGVFLQSVQDKYFYWVACWMDLTGKGQSKRFSVKTYGNLARDLAINYRKQRIMELNLLGAGYSERHGENTNG